MHGLGALLLLGALVVAATGSQGSNPGTSDADSARKLKVSAFPEHPPEAEKPPSIDLKPPAKRRPYPKPSNDTRRPGAPPAGSPVASGRTRAPRPRPRQYQPTIGDLLGIYALPQLGPGGGMPPNGYPQFGQGFNNPGPMPQQYPGFNRPNPPPYFAGQWPSNQFQQSHFHNRPLGPVQALHDPNGQFPAPPPASKLFFGKDQMTALLNLPSQLTAMMQRVGVLAFSNRLTEWLQSLPIQTQPPIDGRLGDVVGCVQGTPAGQRAGQKPGDGVAATKVEATTSESVLVEGAAD